ncbi:MAG: hypothetical protein IKP12_00455 [Acholeplasmatales bacterium]|nr:hypothetical protein [Acholeplasmatales bacterium]
MVDQFYNHMMENLTSELYKLNTIYEPGTMKEYKVVDLKQWPKLKDTCDSILAYETTIKKSNNLMKYYSEYVYPLINDGKQLKQGFHKYYGFRIDNYDFIQMMQKIDSMMKLDF